MKKYIYSILVLAVTGAVLSALLIMQHYYPESDIALKTCSVGFDNPCHSLSMTRYSSILGVPLAVYGLFFYLFLTFTILMADYAREHYYRIAAALILTLSALALITDAVLAVILVKTGYFCHLCIATYIATILMFSSALLWVKAMIQEEGAGAKEWLLKTAGTLFKTAGDRAALSSFTLFTIILAFSLFSTSHIMDIKTRKRRISDKQVTNYIHKFYGSEITQINLPPSQLVLGSPDAQITISAFTDFLCSACYSFYKTEKYLFARFPGKIRLIYYNFPLDQNCNKYVRRTIYENSCVAANAVNAAAEMGILEEYLTVHFNHYKEIKHDYSEEKALEILAEVGKITGTKLSADKFRELMNSDKVTGIINTDMDLAENHGFSATPTLILAGRVIKGAPPKEMLEEIVKKELAKSAE